MKIGKGVEWASHTCALLALLPANGTLALDTLTGAGSSLSTNGIQAYGADGVGGVTNVSEPSSIALFSLGLIGLGLLRSRRTE